MDINEEVLQKLYARLDALQRQNDSAKQEIDALRKAIDSFKPISAAKSEPLVTANDIEAPPKKISVPPPPPPPPIVEQKPIQQTYIPPQPKTRTKSELESFIGENLISKIGILIIFIGVVIGVKYAIDHQLISPLTRIILGYVVGAGLLGFAIKLKTKYENLSATLVSGAIGILYFVTYAGYDFYNLFPQLAAFALMLVFTAFTIVAAIQYNRQIIAHIGLVGAYAIPFLLSSGSGRVDILFSYMAIINTGILVIAFKRYWSPLFYAAFVFTWLIYSTWLFTDYTHSKHFAIATGFGSLFFVINYVMVLAYKLYRKELMSTINTTIMLANAFIYYGVGYYILDNNKLTSAYTGLFTVANAVVHFIVSVIIYRRGVADRNLFYMVIGLVLTFITIAIPVQLNGNWVTMLWAGEFLILFWVGRSKDIAVYEGLSYAALLLSLASLFEDWSLGYAGFEHTIPVVLNIQFLTSVLIIIVVGLANYINHKNSVSESNRLYGIQLLISSFLKVLIVGLPFFAIQLEIQNFWDTLYNASAIEATASDNYKYTTHNHDYQLFKNLSAINFTLLYVAILSWVNMLKFRNDNVAKLSLTLNWISLVYFLLIGLYNLSALRESYLQSSGDAYFEHGTINLAARYISYLFVAFLLWTTYKYVKYDFFNSITRKGFDLGLNTILVWIASSELIQWMDLSNSNQSYKLGLSILWGSYALLLIAYGILKGKQHLRIAAIALFGVTLVKLFIYDISHLNTISKTIVFVSLGVLLLIISFLYTKYKHLIQDEGEVKNVGKETDTNETTA